MKVTQGNMNPPKIAQGILQTILKNDLLEEVMGDLEEKYTEKARLDSKRAADLSYWYQTFHYLRPFAIRPDLLSKLNPFFMWRHNFKITLRKFRRNKTSFLDKSDWFVYRISLRTFDIFMGTG